MVGEFLAQLLVEAGLAAGTPKRAQLGCLVGSIALLFLLIGLLWWATW
jgi:hypothetical protein